MTSSARFRRLTPAQAVGKAAQLLGDLVGRHGQVGDMVATMAHSPALLAGYLDLSRAMKRAKLDRRTSELVSVAVQARLGCDTCLAAHEAAAHSVGVPVDEITAARHATSSDPRVGRLLRFATAVLDQPAQVTAADIDELRAHGWTDREILDTVGVVGLNQLTASFNLVAGL